MFGGGAGLQIDMAKMHRILATLVLCTVITGGLADQKSFDCKMRQVGMDYARKIQPFLTKTHLQEIADALNGAQEAQNCSVSIPDSISGLSQIRMTTRSSPGATSTAFYVDAAKGSDSNTGSMDSPFQTIGKAVTAARAAGQGSTIMLREGTFYLTKTIELGSQDKGLTIQNYENEEVWVSGGKIIKPNWEKFDVDSSKKTNIYKADLSSQGITSVPGLRVNTKRAIRARYPNADPEIGFGSSLTPSSWLPPTLPTKPDSQIDPAEPIRNSSDWFKKYTLGVGGPCKVFDPPAGYWCSTNNARTPLFMVPSGMVADKTVLPNSPYKTPKGAIVHTWRPAHWASWMFEVDSYNASSGTFVFGKGGFQGGHGDKIGAEIVVENVMEELDSPNEWFFDEDSKTLYFFYNATSGTEPPSNTLYVVTQLKTLILINGSMSDPIQNITISGINFRDTAYTYMDPHGMPSGGDWALQRMGALFLEGTENVTIEHGIFERLDGNAIMVSGYNRNTTIQYNEFVWIGDSAIAQWGYTSGTDIPGMGWDGTDGNQPQYSRILYNFIHELGIWEKQSSFYFQAKSCQNLIKGNIFFNGPRAGVNFNDGFGGGSNLTENILFNTCRESGDHGPFNSWDRQVYVTKVLDGTPRPDKLYDYITANFVIANYHSQEAIDNDDGSNYYKTSGNFFAYSGNGMKNDFGGHDNWHFNNIYAYVGRGFGINGQYPGHEDYFYNNSVVMTRDGDYGNPQCTDPGKTIVHDNRIYTPNGKVTECKMTLEEWQAKGNDQGTTAAKWPDDDALVKMIQQLLDI